MVGDRRDKVKWLLVEATGRMKRISLCLSALLCEKKGPANERNGHMQSEKGGVD
jgi:hypothetical protein